MTVFANVSVVSVNLESSARLMIFKLYSCFFLAIQWRDLF